MDLCHFGALSGEWPRLTHLDPALKVKAPRLRLIGKCVCLLNLKDNACTYCFQEVHTNSPLHRQIISQIHTKRSGVGVEVV